MTLRRKDTAWRKSRKFGDVHGGRLKPKLSDGVFRHFHDLKPPGPLDDLPVVIRDNPSRDFFFPLSTDEALTALHEFPHEATDHITHLWFRAVKRSEYERANLPFASFIEGSGVRLIVLYPWPRDLRLWLGGPRRPTRRALRQFSRWTEDLVEDDGRWYLRWTEEAVRRFYLEDLIAHEVGHLVDSSRRLWSKANLKSREEFAIQYAIEWSRAGREVLIADPDDAG